MATPKRLGPAFLTTSAANVFTPPASTMFDTILHIHVANVTTAIAKFTLYVGATGGSTAGTELFKNKSVAANDVFDYYCAMPMLSTDFLSGLADTASALVITIEVERAVVP